MNYNKVNGKIVNTVHKINAKTLDIELVVHLPEDVISTRISPDGTKMVAWMGRGTEDNTSYSMEVYSFVDGYHLYSVPIKKRIGGYSFIDNNRLAVIKERGANPDTDKLQIWEWPNE